MFAFSFVGFISAPKKTPVMDDKKATTLVRKSSNGPSTSPVRKTSNTSNGGTTIPKKPRKKRIAVKAPPPTETTANELTVESVEPIVAPSLSEVKIESVIPLDVATEQLKMVDLTVDAKPLIEESDTYDLAKSAKSRSSSSSSSAISDASLEENLTLPADSSMNLSLLTRSLSDQHLSFEDCDSSVVDDFNSDNESGFSVTSADVEPESASPSPVEELSHTWHFRRGHLLQETQDDQNTTAGEANLEHVCTIKNFMEFRRFWGTVCSIDNSSIGRILQFARGDFTCDKAEGYWMVRFSSDPGLVASIWADVLLAFMGFVDDGTHPLRDHSLCAEVFLGYDICCLRLWVEQSSINYTAAQLRDALGLPLVTHVSFESWS